MRKVQKVPKVPEFFAIFLANPYGRFGTFLTLISPLYVPCFRLMGEVFCRKAFSSAYGLKLYFCLSTSTVSHVQHRLVTQEEVQKMRKVPKVPEFSPFPWQIIRSDSALFGANLPAFCTMFPPNGGGCLFEGRHLVQLMA